MSVENAQKTIEQILEALEKETGCTVEAVHIHSFDVTTYEDEGRKLVQSVRIELKRQPGTRWQTA